MWHDVAKTDDIATGGMKYGAPATPSARSASASTTARITR